jgi:hypothetical protein
MNCYECDQHNIERAAVARCQNCSAGLCREHALVKSRDVTTHALLNRIVTLPIEAREMLCQVCKRALEQPRLVA